MTAQFQDLGGGHSPREWDARTGTFIDDSTTPASERGAMLARPRRGMTVTGAVLGVGLLLLAWTVRGRWPGFARMFRRRARWF